MPVLEKPLKKSSPEEKRKPEVVEELEEVGVPSCQANYALRLYVSGSTLKSARAVLNIKRICEEYLKNSYHLEVIDVYQQPDLARGDQIVAVPTLIRRSPLPQRKLVGDLSNTEKVLLGLDLS